MIKNVNGWEAKSTDQSLASHPFGASQGLTFKSYRVIDELSLVIK